MYKLTATSLVFTGKRKRLKSLSPLVSQEADQSLRVDEYVAMIQVRSFSSDLCCVTNVSCERITLLCDPLFSSCVCTIFLLTTGRRHHGEECLHHETVRHPL